MASLLDAINKNLKPSTPAQQAPQLGETEQVRRLVRAKSGKAVGPSSGPAQSSLGERVVAGQTRLGQQQLASQAKLIGEQQGQQAADIAQREQQQATQFEQQREQQKADYSRQADSILNQYTQGNKQLSTQKDLANIEQAGAALRLSNQQYIDRLQTEGQRARLDNDVNFKTQMAQNVFSDAEDLLSNQLAFKAIMDADDREFRNQIAQIDAATALDMARSEIEATKAGNIWTGVGNLAQTAISAYAKEGES